MGLKARRRRKPPPLSARTVELVDGILIVVQGLEPPSLNGRGGLIRADWRARRRRLETLKLVLLAARPPRLYARRCRVHYVRSYAARPLDADNLAASFKLVGDALVSIGVLRDDDRLELRPAQRPRGGRGPFFTVAIRATAPNP